MGFVPVKYLQRHYYMYRRNKNNHASTSVHVLNIERVHVCATTSRESSVSSNASIVRVLGHPPQIQTRSIYSAFMFEASSHKFWNRAVER